MVSKCANPECATPFRYFHEGKLFRVETEVGPERRREMGRDRGAKKSMRKLEFYWLCDRCAERMTVLSEKGMGVSVRPHFAASATAA